VAYSQIAVLWVLGELEIYRGMPSRYAQLGVFGNIRHALAAIINFSAISEAFQELFCCSKTHSRAPRIVCLASCLIWAERPDERKVHTCALQIETRFALLFGQGF